MNVLKNFDMENQMLVRYKGDEAEVTVPEGVKFIGEEAFASLRALEKLSLPESLEEVGPYAFWSSGVESLEITLPAGVKTVGENAFQNAGSGKVTYKGTNDAVKAALGAN